MTYHWRSLRAAAAGTLVVALGTTAGTAAPPAQASKPTYPRPETRSVTLVTGDRVEASPDLKQVRFVPGPGRERTRFTIRRTARQVYVVPLDALGLLGRQRLDPRLFELTELLKYDDKQRQDLPLIVRGTASTRDAAVRAAGGTENRALTSVGSVATRIPKDRLPGFFGALSRGGQVTKVWLDGIRQPLLDKSVPQIGAPAVWAAGFTGKGVKVAVLDGGVDPGHPDLKDRLTSADFTGTDPGDANGHGTHVASTVAGSGAASDGRYKGVAPDAQILSGKVCGAQNCFESEILAGMDWAVQQGARIVNLSLGGGNGPGIDLLEEAVNKYSAANGTLFVIAAGNSGAPGSISSPGSAEAALTVGAVDAADKIADFSSRGPAQELGVLKPDATAPGVGIVAARSATSSIGEPVGTSYLRLSGTSMATPHIAGAAALLAQAHPDWTGAQLKSALVGSAKVLPDIPMTHQGAGRVDVAAAAKLTVLADQAAVGFDQQRWPHTDDKPQAKVVTYTNHGDGPVEVELAATFTGPDGKPAPDTALQLSTTKLTVPAKGTAEVTVTSNTKHAGPTGDYTGRLVATSEGRTLTTTLAVHSEQESYDLTVKHLDRTGASTADYWDFVVDRDAVEEQDDTKIFLNGADGVTRIRLPKGPYLLESLYGQDHSSVSLVQPKVDLTTDRTITMDARQAQPVAITVPNQAAKHSHTIAAYELWNGFYHYGGGVGTLDITQPIYVGQVGPSVRGLTATMDSESSVPGAEGEPVLNSPAVYQLHWSKLDGWFHGFSKQVRHEELATLRPTFTADTGASEASWSLYRSAPHINVQLVNSYGYDHLPATPTVYVTRTSSVQSLPTVAYRNDSDGIGFNGPAITCRTGRSCADTWGQAVFGPALASTPTTRDGDTLTLLATGIDAQGRDYGIRSGNGSFTVSRNGTALGTFTNDKHEPATLQVPAGPGAFQLDFTSGAGPLSLSTKTSTSWKFSSTRTTSRTALPLWVAAFQPPVDDHNAVRAGQSHQLPTRLNAQTGAQVGKLQKVKLWTSADDGKTWKETPVTGAGTQRRAVVTAPTGNGYLSLKLEATDSAGNSVKQEILRAYKYAG